MKPLLDRFMAENHKQIDLGDADCRQILDAIPAAIYATDPDGRITFCNRTAVEMLGRIPDLSNDRWCISWRMCRPDGTPLPHDECPMATALKEGKAVPGVDVIVERPDGCRAYVMPVPHSYFRHGRQSEGWREFCCRHGITWDINLDLNSPVDELPSDSSVRDGSATSNGEARVSDVTNP